MTVVTVQGRVITRVKSRVLSVLARILRPGIRVVVGGTSTVSGSRRIILNTLPLRRRRIASAKRRQWPAIMLVGFFLQRNSTNLSLCRMASQYFSWTKARRMWGSLIYRGPCSYRGQQWPKARALSAAVAAAASPSDAAPSAELLPSAPPRPRRWPSPRPPLPTPPRPPLRCAGAIRRLVGLGVGHGAVGPFLWPSQSPPQPRRRRAATVRRPQAPGCQLLTSAQSLQPEPPQPAPAAATCPGPGPPAPSPAAAPGAEPPLAPGLVSPAAAPASAASASPSDAAPTASDGNGGAFSSITHCCPAQCVGFGLVGIKDRRDSTE